MKAKPFLGFFGRLIEEKRREVKGKEEDEGEGEDNLEVRKKGFRVKEDMV